MRLPTALPSHTPPYIRPVAAGLAVALAAAGAALTVPRPGPARFEPPVRSAPVSVAPQLRGKPALAATDGFLPRVAPSAHAVNLLALANGDVLASWFAGSKEGAPDVAIYLARWHAAGTGHHGGLWSEPRAVATRAATQAATGRYVRKLGNAVLGQDPEGRLHLWFVSVAFGGWAGSSINQQVSDDEGRTWTPAQRLVTSPFLNISTLVRTPPLWPELGGGAGLPVYHEFIAKHGEWLRLDDDGHVLDKARLPQPRRALQPAVAALDDGDLLALLRDAGPGPGRVLAATSADGGASWRPAEPLPVANPNAAVALLRLADGRLLLACNPIAGGRNRLALWLSEDQGDNWYEARVLEESNDGEDEFSYPALAQDRAGRVHVAYTWKRETIRHRVLTPDTLQEVRR